MFSLFRKPSRRTGKTGRFHICVLDIVELETRVAPAAFDPTFVIFQPADGMVPFDGFANPSGITPSQMRTAYGVNLASFAGIAGDGTGRTIAIVDAYNQPNIASDLTAFDSYYGLQDPPNFTVRNQSGGTTLPSNSAIGDWSVEITLDVEWAHVIAPNASIVLFEANSNSSSDLFAAVDAARNYSGVSVVSMSFGAAESSGNTSSNSHFTTPSGHIGVTFLASTGDNGAEVEYPAASPNVVAVGGTNLNVGSSGTYFSESGWDGSGGGISNFQSLPSYQSGVVTQSSTNRCVPDIAMDADPNTGVPIYDTYDNSTSTPWTELGGTSLAAPMWAGVIAIANQGRVQYGLTTLDGPSGTLPKLYALPTSDFHDITTGNNGYAAGVGYDLVTGRGTPIVNLLVNGLAPPVVSGLNPTSGPVSGGTSVVITGVGFTGATSVKFGGTNAASFTVNSDTQITAVAPPGGGVVDATVTDGGGGVSATSSADHFTYLGAVVTGVNPNYGPAAGGTNVIISGTGFTGATAVQFGGINAATYTVNSSTQITATSPAGSGVVDVTVTTPVGGASAPTNADHFTYVTVFVTASTVSVPDSSTTITINGSGFSTTPANNSVAFNLGVVGAVTAATATQLTVTLTTPPTALGSLTAVVTSNGSSSFAPVQVATEVPGTWTVASSSGGSGNLAAPTLPYAIAHALNGDQVNFASGLSAITLGGTLTISHNITITGPGPANLAVSGNNSIQVFVINSGVTATISGLKVQNGHGAGGGIKNQGTLSLSNDTFSNNAGTTSGGGVYNTGTLTISNSNFSGNSAPFGGGIANSGTATVTGCSFTGNNATSTGGGAIVNYMGTLTLSNSTLANNSAATGGGIDNYQGTVRLSNDTIAYNTATNTTHAGGGVYNNSSLATLTMIDTIVAGNHLNSSANDVHGIISVANYDVIGTTSGMTISSGTGNHLNVSAGLASSLANNGGPTQTIALTPGSVAMNNGGALTTIATGHPAGVSDTTIYVANAGAIAQTAGSYYILIGSEQILVTAINTTNNTLTVQRGVNGTTAASHSVGSSVFFAMDQRGIIKPTPAAIGAFQLEQLTSSVIALPANSTGMTIIGSAFDPTAANDSVAFSNGVTGVVTAATSTTLTVSLTGLGSVPGGTALNASATVNGVSSGNPVQVATVIPVTTASSASIPDTATSMTIAGFGFDANPANDSVTFDNGVTGAVTAATSFGLAVSVVGLGSLPAGTLLHASVTANGASSGSAVQVASIDTIITQPSSQTIDAGQDASFTAAAYDPDDAVQWQVNTGSGFTNVTDGGFYSGANTPTLVITAADTTLDGAQYQAVFTDSGGTLTSNSATLYITGADATTTTLTDNGPNPSAFGQAVSFTVTVSGGAPINGQTVFIEDTDNAYDVVASPTLVNSAVTFDISDLAVGQHHLIAVYNGDSTHAASNTSATPVLQTVNSGGAAPVLVSAEVNGGYGLVANSDYYIDGQGSTFDLSGQNSVVVSLLLTFNEPVSLDAGAFTVVPETTTNVQGTPGQVYVVYGSVPDQAAVTVNSPVAVGGGATATQWVITFSGAGTTPIGEPGYMGVGNILKDGVYNFNMDGAKVHANAQTAPNANDTFWKMFGANSLFQSNGANGFDGSNGGTLSPVPGDGTSEIFLDPIDVVEFNGHFLADSTNLFAPPYYDPAMDADLSGFYDGFDVAAFNGNYLNDWTF